MLLAPVHLAALPTAARSFAGNPILGSERLNALGLHRSRVALAARMAELRRARIAAALPAGEVATFERDGIVVRHQALPPALFARLREAIEGLRAPAREMLQGDALSRLVPVTPEVMRRLGPEIGGLLAAPPWLPLLHYAGSARVRPLQFIQTIFSHVMPGGHDPQLELHADTFYPSVKAWLYLGDVAEEDGPFAYVPGSHRVTPARLDWEKARSLSWRQDPNGHSRRGSLRVSPEELAAMGLGAPVTYAAPANTLIVADTFGFHARGPSLRPSARLSLWWQGRRNPFLPWAGPLLPPLPGLRHREAALGWALLDRLAARGLAGQPFRDVGEVMPLDPPGPRSPAWRG